MTLDPSKCQTCSQELSVCQPPSDRQECPHFTDEAAHFSLIQLGSPTPSHSWLEAETLGREGQEELKSEGEARGRAGGSVKRRQGSIWCSPVWPLAQQPPHWEVGAQHCSQGPQ